MCGVVGFIGGERAAPVLLNSLRQLEYRGYDSAGIATVSDSQICCRKGAGKLDQVQCSQHLDELSGECGIGHVRWATHGRVNSRNAHPHGDCRHEIAVVHNGIIENYQQLRQRLQASHRFVSDTDTEVVPHLLEEYMAGGLSLEQAMLRVVAELEGSYALIAISSREPDKMVATRKESPLVVGEGAGSNFLASDSFAFLGATDRVAFVDDGETVVVSRDRVTFLDRGGREIEKEFVALGWRPEEASKQGYPFFMLKEIMEQPQASCRTLVQDRGQIMEMALDILRARQVVLTACGTSRYAALIGRYLFSRLAGKFCDVVMGSEFHYFSDSIDKNTLVLAISQSGETADVMEGVRRARENGASVFSLVNVPGSSLARMSHQVLYLNCGPEIGVAATKSFASQLALFYMLAFAMVNRLEEGIDKLRAVFAMIEQNFTENGEKLKALAWQTRHKKDFYYIARGINFAVAAEGALKAKEVAYVHAEGMPAGELKHGTLALIQKGTPVVVICPRDYTFQETLANAAETRARGALVIGVSDEYNPIFHQWINLPRAEDIFYPLVAIVPLQLVAYHLAVARGKDPDKPRNLAKSVTVK